MIMSRCTPLPGDQATAVEANDKSDATELASSSAVESTARYSDAKEAPFAELNRAETALCTYSKLLVLYASSGEVSTGKRTAPLLEYIGSPLGFVLCYHFAVHVRSICC